MYLFIIKKRIHLFDVLGSFAKSDNKSVNKQTFIEIPRLWYSLIDGQLAVIDSVMHNIIADNNVRP